MSRYTTRIELHSGLYNPDFEVLHRAMANEGFEKVITSDSGRTFHLPRGEYYTETVKTISQVLEAAKRAVAATRRSAEIVITESRAISWDGLTEAK